MSSSPALPGTHPLQRGLQAVVVAVLLVGVAVPNVSVVVNATLALGVTELPAVLRRDHELVLGTWPTLWISSAVALHALGMVVLYDLVPWWDHLTHLVSGSLIAGVGYALVRTIDEHAESVHIPHPFLGLVVVLFTLAAGVTWEVVEMVGREVARALDMAPILVVYGIDDTMLDLVFDALGGVLVALFVGQHLEGTVEDLVGRFRRDSA